MKLKDIIEQVVPATQSSDVEGVPKVMSPIVRRKVPAGYIETTKKNKKKKKIQEEESQEEAPDAYDYLSSKSKNPSSSYGGLNKTFQGNRPKYKPKLNFLFKKIRGKKGKKIHEQAAIPGLTQTAPYQDLELLRKFWRGSKSGEEKVSGKTKKDKTAKSKKKKPQGSYQPEVQKDKEQYQGITPSTGWSYRSVRPADSP